MADRTEAASQPREGDGERLRLRIAAIIDPDAALPQWRQFNRDMWQGRQNAALAKADRVIAALTQRPPEQAGAVPAAIVWQQRAINMLQAQKRAWLCGGSDCTDYDHGRDEGFDLAVAVLRGLNPSAPEVRAMLSAAPTPPDAGSGEIPAGMVETGREGCVGSMDPKRASYFLERFKREEMLLGPHEQWALDYTIAVLAAPTPPDAGIGSDGAGERV